MYEVATTGSEDEKIAAASILCGASLFRGWSIQVCLALDSVSVIFNSRKFYCSHCSTQMFILQPHHLLYFNSISD